MLWRDSFCSLFLPRTTPFAYLRFLTFVRQARALYEYEATNENELSFPEGAILNIQEKDDSGWWFAELGGKTGFIPNNYVEVV